MMINKPSLLWWALLFIAVVILVAVLFFFGFIPPPSRWSADYVVTSITVLIPVFFVALIIFLAFKVLK